MPSFIVVGYVWQILGSWGTFWLSPSDPWAAPKRPTQNTIRNFSKLKGKHLGVSFSKRLATLFQKGLPHKKTVPRCYPSKVFLKMWFLYNSSVKHFQATLNFNVISWFLETKHFLFMRIHFILFINFESVLLIDYFVKRKALN